MAQEVWLADVLQLLRLIIDIRQLTINEVDKKDTDDVDSDLETNVVSNSGPSKAAREAIEDFSEFHLATEDT